MESLAPLMDHLDLSYPSISYSSTGHPIVGVCEGQPWAVAPATVANCTVYDITNFNPTLNYFYNYFADKFLAYDSYTDMTLWPNILVASMSVFNHTFIFSLWGLVVAILFFVFLGKYDGIIKKQQEEYN